MTQLVNQTEERTPNVTREPPEWIVREVKKIGGMESGQPRFRVIWGGNRWTVAPDGITLVRPYRVDMWHLEKFHEGEYEHCYRLGECPSPGHRKSEKDPWCRKCFLDGGVPIDAGHSLALIETAIRLLLRTEELQRTTRFAFQQREALFTREATKSDLKDVRIREATEDAAPRTVKRSFETPLRLSANQTLGTRKGLRQLNALEIARGLRKRRKTA